MKRKTKFMIGSSVFMLGVTGIGTLKAHATGRIGSNLGFGMEVFLKNFHGRGTYGVTSGVNIDRKFKSQVQSMVKRGQTTGLDSRDIILGSPRAYSASNYYFKTLINGRKHMYTAVNKPDVTNIDGLNVTVKYTDVNGMEKTLTTTGFPKWISGLDIIADGIKIKDSQAKQALLKRAASSPDLIDFENSPLEQGAVGGVDSENKKSTGLLSRFTSSLRRTKKEKEKQENKLVNLESRLKEVPTGILVEIDEENVPTDRLINID